MCVELKEAGNRIVGLKQLLRELNNDTVLRIYIADDADLHVKGKVRKALGGRDIEVVSIKTMDDLGGVCGIDVGAAVAAILK